MCMMYTVYISAADTVADVFRYVTSKITPIYHRPAGKKQNTMCFRINI